MNISTNLPRPANLAPTPVLNYGDPSIQALASKLRSLHTSDRRFVQDAHRYITGTVKPVYTLNELQPASRTLRKQKGSCSQRMACLEAIARAGGVPTRVHALQVSGKFWRPRFPAFETLIPRSILLVWPQFYADGAWVDVDELYASAIDLAGVAENGFSNVGELGENLIKANSGMEAFEQLLKVEIAVIVMDVSMPGMDGFETAQMIHEHPRFHDLAIIFVSGILVSDLDRLKGYQHGAVDYVSVPVVPELLRAKVKVFADLYRKNRQLETLNQRIINLRDEERRQIARELHDSIGQVLAGLSMNNALLQSQSLHLGGEITKLLAENAALIQDAIKQTRTISYLLHPPLLDEAGLVSALRCYVEGFSQRSNVLVTMNIPEHFTCLSKEMELCIFRIVQECLTNVHRHAESPTAGIRVSQDESCLRVEVEDAGKGIPWADQETLEPPQTGVGLRGMQERLRHFGGTLQVHSNRNGTRVTATLPVARMTPSTADPLVSAGKST